MHKIFTIIYSTSITSLVLLAFATIPTTAVYAGDCVPPSSFLLPRWYDGLCKNGTDKIESPVSGGGDTGTQLGTFLAKIAMNIVTIILYIVGYVSLIFIIVGGFKYMTGGDNSSGTVAARKTIQNAVIGLILSIASVAIVKFVAGVV